MFKNYEDYKDFSEQTPSKKILAYFLDAILIALVCVLASVLIVSPTFVNSSNYKNTVSSMRDDMIQIFNIQEEAKLSCKINDEEILDQNKLTEKYLDMHISLSYFYHEQDFNNSGITIQDISNKASYDNDLIGYYFAIYKKEKNINVNDFSSLSGKEYFLSLINSDTTIKDYFETNNDELPSLKSNIAINIYQYKKEKIKDSTTYDNMSSFFLILNSKGLLDLHNYQPYENAYNKYINNYFYLSRMQNTAIIVLYLIVFILCMVLPMVFFGNGITLGRYISKSRVVYKKNTALSILLSCLINLIIMFPFGCVGGLIAYGTGSLTTPFLGQISLELILLLTFVISIIDFFILTFSSKKKSLSELASRTYLVDVKKNIYNE